MFNDIQKASLAAPLHREHVKQRSQSGRSLSYVESWYVISEANRIFGFDAWCSETIEIRCVAERERKIGQSGKDGWGVSYIAKVRVTVDGVIRDGVGSGHGIDVDLGLAHESAIKEAESDARKRCLMTFGNPFGLALYDKAQENVVSGPSPAEVEAMGYVARCKTDLQQVETTDELREWWKVEAKNRQLHGFTKDDPLYQDLYKAMVARGEALAGPQKVAAQ